MSHSPRPASVPASPGPQSPEQQRPQSGSPPAAGPSTPDFTTPSHATPTQHTPAAHFPRTLSTPSSSPVNGSLRFEAVQELQPPPSDASCSAGPGAISAKSLAPSSSTGTSPPQGQPRSCRDGRDNREKHVISSADARIAETSRANLSAAPSRDQPSSSHPHPRTPSPPSMEEHVAARDLAVARVAATSAPSLSLCPSPVPVVPAPADASTASAQPAPAPQHLHRAHGAMSDTYHVHEEKTPSEVAARPSSVPAPPKQQFAESLRRLFQARSHAPPPTSTSPAPSSASIDTACHCLIVDAQRLSRAADAPDTQQLEAALALASDRDALRAHIQQWILDKHQLPAEELSVAYVCSKQSRQLHLNFCSQEGLSRALAQVPFLVRCGTTAAAQGAWGRVQTCGKQRHQLPELLQFTCVPPRPRELSALRPDVERLLAEAKLEHTALWFQSQQRGAARGPQGRIVFYVLPRHMATLREDIGRLHKQLELWGSKLRVSAPNDPALARCAQCEQLGHQSTACSQFAGLAIRLLFKQPAPFSLLQTIGQRAGARLAYLGSGPEESQPSRRMTLLFPVAEEDAEQLAMLQEKLEPLVAELQPLLFEAPALVQTKQRQRECHECGYVRRDRDDAHACPFSPLRAIRSIAPPPLGRSPALPARPPGMPSAERGSAGSGRQPSSRPSDRMCHSWRQNKTCPRKDKGAVCQWEHPEAHVPEPKRCHQWDAQGHCSRGTLCRFDHLPRAERQAAAAQEEEEEEKESSFPRSDPTLPQREVQPTLSAPQAATMSGQASAAAQSVRSPPKRSKRPREDDASTEVGQAQSAPQATPPQSPAASSSAPAGGSTTPTGPGTPARHRPTARPQSAACDEEVDAGAPVGTPRKKRHVAPASSTSGKPTAARPLRWGDVEDDEPESSDEAMAAPSTPVSSLSLLASPSPVKGRGGGSKAQQSSSKLRRSLSGPAKPATAREQ